MFTYIRKSVTPFGPQDSAQDINMMPPLVVKNALPFSLYLRFIDSSGVARKETFGRNEEKNFSCFSMATAVKVDLFVHGFRVVRDLALGDAVDLEDDEGRTTRVYS
mmetsp:Transcript_10931/g.16596  ORF Transcript_10931/g.16596 Transcript_10931/m.16596 type:complete len:106 (+) Transcript_10931:6065-6382(+)